MSLLILNSTVSVELKCLYGKYWAGALSVYMFVWLFCATSGNFKISVCRVVNFCCSADHVMLAVRGSWNAKVLCYHGNIFCNSFVLKYEASLLYRFSPNFQYMFNVRGTVAD